MKKLPDGGFFVLNRVFMILEKGSDIAFSPVS
jgi:hypothetical protein